jgi:hypothetical protein
MKTMNQVRDFSNFDDYLEDKSFTEMKNQIQNLQGLLPFLSMNIVRLKSQGVNIPGYADFESDLTQLPAHLKTLDDLCFALSLVKEKAA